MLSQRPSSRRVPCSHYRVQLDEAAGAEEDGSRESHFSGDCNGCNPNLQTDWWSHLPLAQAFPYPILKLTHWIMPKPSEQVQTTCFLSSTFKSIDSFSLQDSVIKNLYEKCTFVALRKWCKQQGRAMMSQAFTKGGSPIPWRFE